MTIEYSIDEISKYLADNDLVNLKIYMNNHDLEVINNKIVPKDREYFVKKREFYDQRQLIKKILLNSLYGAVGNAGSRWFDPRIAQSVTLTGRCIVKHMQSKINEIIAGDYNHLGESCIYGDSVTGDTLIKTDAGEISIEQLFNECVEHCNVKEKEYGLWSQAKVIGFNSHEMESTINNIEYVMRHKTKKKLYQIIIDNGKKITVTEDHSVMIDRDGFLIEVKPADILETDNIITLVTDDILRT